MTTETAPSTAAWADAVSFVRYALLALAIWAGVAAAITVIAEPTPDAMVIAPTTDLAVLLHGSDTRITDVQRGYVLVRGMEKGFVAELYRNGAWLVLPARPGGCLSLQGLAR